MMRMDVGDMYSSMGDDGKYRRGQCTLRVLCASYK